MIPLIDPRVRYVGPTALRALNAKALKELKDVLVVQVDEAPVAVVMPYGLYMKLQEAIWPSSLLPALEKFLSSDGPCADKESDIRDRYCVYCDEAEDGDHRKCEARWAETQADSNGNLAVKTAGEEETLLPSVRQIDAEEKKVKAVDCHPEVVMDSIPFNKDSVAARIQREGFGRDIELTAIGTDMTPRGQMPTARVDDSQPLIIDDIDDGEGPRCHHCGKLNASILCSDCFLSGHRGGGCLVCPEKTDE